MASKNGLRFLIVFTNRQMVKMEISLRSVILRYRIAFSYVRKYRCTHYTTRSKSHADGLIGNRSNFLVENRA